MVVSGQSREVHEFLQALGITTERVQSVDIHIVHDDVVTINVRSIVTGEQLENAKRVLTQYRLKAEQI